MLIFISGAIGISIAFTKLMIFEVLRGLLSGISDSDFYFSHKKNNHWQAYVGKLVRCPACFGFWVGSIGYYFIQKAVVVESLLVGFSVCWLALFFWSVMEKMGVK